MMNFVRSRSTFLNWGPRYSSHSDASCSSAKKTLPTKGDTSAKKLIFSPTPSNKRATNDWTTLAWLMDPSGTMDGKFGPAKIMLGWGDCWFLATIAAVANDPNGDQILNESIKEVDGGYEVTFKGSPHHAVFISFYELRKCVDENGGDADTRLLQLAADKFFNTSGNFKSLFIAILMQSKISQEEAEQCLNDFCQKNGVQDRMTYNPMRSGWAAEFAFVMLTGMQPDIVDVTQSHQVMSLLNQYVHATSGGSSVVICGRQNPLGDNDNSNNLVIEWDVIRTEITSTGSPASPLSSQQQAFLNALVKWLETRMSFDLEALKSAAANLELTHSNPVNFVNMLSENLFHMNQDHFNLLRSGVQEVLVGGPGYIGFAGDHVGTIEGIDEAYSTFTYSEPNNPEMVHNGRLSDLIEAVINDNVRLVVCHPSATQYAGESSGHAGTSRGRRLSELHKQAIKDGKIDQTESGLLADLLEMDDGTFRQLFDSDQNGVIEGSELKAVQLRLDRWVERLRLTPIW